MALTAKECPGRILIYSGGLPLEKVAGMHALSIDSGTQSFHLPDRNCLYSAKKKNFPVLFTASFLDWSFERNPDFVLTGAFDRKSEQNLMFLLPYGLLRKILPRGAENSCLEVYCAPVFFTILISPPSDPQDTCVALQALAEYAILSYVGGVNLTISLASTNLDYQETFELNKMNKKVLQTAVVGGSVQADFQST